MRVLFIIDSLIGYGAEKSLVEIIINFKKIIPTVVHLYKGEQLKEKLLKSGVKVYSLNLERSAKLNEKVRVVKTIISIEKPEIIHTTLFSSDMVGRELKKLFPEILLVGSFVSNSYSKYRYQQISVLNKLKLLSTQFRDRFTSGIVDFYISNSHAILESNAKILKIPKEKIKVIYRGRNIEENIKIAEDSNFFFPHFKNKTIFLNIGRLQINKGQKDLLLAFSNVHRIYPDTILVLIGEGVLRHELEKLVKEKNISEAVYILGYRNDANYFLNKADFFVFPSYFEGLPGVLIEAMLSNTPIIASNIPENKECFPGKTALFFEPGNITELEEKMIKALTLEYWDEKTQQAREYALHHFNINKVSKEYEEFYFNLQEKLLDP